MNIQEDVPLQCPYCGETINVIVDCSIEQQEYVEDCQVCCQPIKLEIMIQKGSSPQIKASQENE